LNIKQTIFNSVGDHETLDLDRPRLAKAMNAVEGLILNGP
jgi:hypothetical protein